jgi:hypothetical protein
MARAFSKNGNAKDSKKDERIELEQRTANKERE